jgi:hypothetical protein
VAFLPLTFDDERLSLVIAVDYWAWFFIFLQLNFPYILRIIVDINIELLLAHFLSQEYGGALQCDSQRPRSGPCYWAEHFGHNTFDGADI